MWGSGGAEVGLDPYPLGTSGLSEWSRCSHRIHNIRVKTREGESPDGLQWSSSVPAWSGRASWRWQSLGGILGEWHLTDKGM